MKNRLRHIVSLLLIICILVACTNKTNIKGIKATLVKDIDGDSAFFLVDGIEIECRFLAIDAPEMKTDMGKFVGKYTNDLLKNAKEIILEGDPLADTTDKYGRYLYWIWVDGELLEANLVSKGYAKVKYIYDHYKYVDELNILQDEAKRNKLGIWK